MPRILLCVLLTLACTETKQNEIKEKCGSEDVREIRKIDNISKACRDALSSFLPGPEDNLKTSLFSFAQSGGDIYLAALDSTGKALETTKLQTLTVKATTAGTTVDVPSTAYTLEAQSAWSGNILSVSLLSDYSGSMQDEDVAEVSSLYSDLVTNINSISEIEHILFSDTVEQKIDFSTDLSALTAAIAVDADFERASTALFDGMSLGLTHLAARSRPGKIIVVGTDGMENASVTASKEQIIAAIAAEKNLLVVFMATNYADLELIKELTGTRGFYAFTRTLSDARSRLLEYSKALKQGVRLRLSAPYDTADSVSVSLPDGSLTKSLEL